MPRTKRQIAREVDAILATPRPQVTKLPAASAAPRTAVSQKSQSLPKLHVTKVYPQQVDEWYGVTAEFKWESPFDINAYHAAARSEEERWFIANPNKVHVGLFPLEKTMAAHIRHEITRSPQWIAFSKRSSMPRFTENDIDDWNFDAHGGSASASTRDSDE